MKRNDFSNLKKKFTLLGTIAMLLLMLILLLIMNIVNFTSVVNESDRVLEMLPGWSPFFTEQEDTAPPEKPEGDAGEGGEGKGGADAVGGVDITDISDTIPHGMSPEVPYEARFFTVMVGENGEIAESDLSRIISVDSESAKEYIEKAIKSGFDRGFIGQFRYLKQADTKGTRITFLDCGRKLDAFFRFLLISAGVGLFGCLVAFVTFLLVSGRIVRPMSEAYEKQKRFISDAGHEMKTPLTIINANVDLLSCDEEKEELEEIRSQTKRLTELTNNLVYLSKMEESGHVLQKIEIPLSDIVAETLQSFSALAASADITLCNNVTAGLSVNASPSAIRQLASILIENAVKYSPSGANVTVDLKPGKRLVVMTVQNMTGEPIEKENLEKVFERFYRTDASRNSTTGGHGIGLSIAKAIAEAHNGTITATTQSGRDFTVTVVLPI